MKHRNLIAAGLVALLTATACGGDDKTDAKTPESSAPAAVSSASAAAPATSAAAETPASSAAAPSSTEAASVAPSTEAASAAPATGADKTGDVTVALQSMGCESALVEMTGAGSGIDPLAGHCAGPVVLVVRDARRFPWQVQVAQRVLAARPDTVVVEMGLPGTPLAPARGYVETRGAGRVNAMAAAELLLGRADGAR